MTLKDTHKKETLSDDHKLPFKPNEAGISSWLSGLPILDGKTSCEMLLSALQALQQTGIKSARRFEILELMRPHIDTLQNYFDNRLLNAAFPLTKELDYISQLQIQLYQQFAREYTSVCESDDFIPGTKWKHHVVALVLQRAFDFWGQVLYRRALAYRKVKSDFWLSVYSLAAIAEKYHLIETEIDGNKPNIPRNRAVQSLFKRILIFVLAHPNRFRQGEIIQIYALTEQFANLSTLQPYAENNAISNCFFIHLNKGVAPQHIKLLPPQNDGDLRFLHTRSIIDQIISAERSITLLNQPGLIKTKPSSRVLMSFIRNLATVKKRRFQRKSNESEHGLFIGLPDLIDALSVPSEQVHDIPALQKEIAENTQGSNTSTLPNTGLVSQENTELGEEKNSPVQANQNVLKIGSMLIDINCQSDQRIDIWEDSEISSDKNTRQIKFTAKLVDSSAKGHGLVWTDKTNPIIKVGEVVGIIREDSDIDVGAIRWIESIDDNTLAFGIELFSPLAEVVTIGLPNLPDTSVKALLLPEIVACQKPMSIILRSPLFKAGTWATLSIDGKEKIYRMEKLIETTAGFSHFTVDRPDSDD